MWQFKDDKIIPHLHLILNKLADRDTITKCLFLLTPINEDPESTPINIMREDKPDLMPIVILKAQQYALQGAK